MSLSQSNVLTALANVIEQLDVSHRPAVYVASEDGPRRLPDAINDTPCVIVIPGQTLEYFLAPGAQRHTYEIVLLVIQTGIGMEVSASALPFVDAVIEKMATNVTLGGLANPVTFARATGLVDIAWGGQEGYTGYQVTLTASEQASASPAAGEQQ